MATLATQTITLAGLDPTYVAAGVGGDEFTPDRDTYLHVKGGAGGCNVTIVTPREAFPGAAIADIVVNVPAGPEERLIGPFPAEHFADPTNGQADVTYSAPSGVTVAVLKVQE